MPRGGKRTGAGRKKGAATKKSQAIAAKACAEGITPLEVMLAAMRHHYEQQDLDRAAEFAKDAAPYCHPRLAPKEVQSKEEVDVDAFIIEELRLAKIEIGGQEAPALPPPPTAGGAEPPTRPGEVHPRGAGGPSQVIVRARR
jgi:hypothetical protein